MIGSFLKRGSQDIFEGEASSAVRRNCPCALWGVARRKLDQLNHVRDLVSLGVPPGNRLEHLKGRGAGQHSIRINEKYRICFVWTKGGPIDVEITDYH